METDSPTLHSMPPEVVKKRYGDSKTGLLALLLVVALEPPPMLIAWGVIVWLFVFIEKRILNRVKIEFEKYLIRKKFTNKV